MTSTSRVQLIVPWKLKWWRVWWNPRSTRRWRMAEAWRKGFLPQAKRASGKRFGALYLDCSVWTAHRPRTAIRVWSHKLKSRYPRPGLAAEKARIYLHEIYRSTAPDLWK